MPKVKLWKNGGKEDKFVGRLLKEGKFTKNTKAIASKRQYPQVFEEFSTNVIRNHLNELKRRNGFYLDRPSDEEEEDEPCIRGKPSEDESLSIEDVDSNLSTPSVGTIIHQNYQFFCETYKDPESLIDKVLVAVSMPGGAHNVKMELNTDGTVVTLKYKWAKIMYNMDDFFKKAVFTGEITLHHPKVVSIKNGLEKCRTRIDAAPESTITINLPIKVQTGANTWKKSKAAREDGSQLVIGEFLDL